MAGATFTVEFDQAPIVDALGRLAAIGERPRRLLGVLGERLVNSTKDRFATNQAPDGTSWAALNPAYAEIRNPKPILVQSGALRDSIHAEVGTSFVRVGSSMIYAGVHQFGATIRPQTAKALVFRLGAGSEIVRVQSVRIPARPYLGISADDEAAIIEDTVAFVERVLR
ncbi:MAG: phage virion morphogenesis protein [Acidiphilium sp.]